jgi:hypothetical protein
MSDMQLSDWRCINRLNQIQEQWSTERGIRWTYLLTNARPQDQGKAHRACNGFNFAALSLLWDAVILSIIDKRSKLKSLVVTLF